MKARVLVTVLGILALALCTTPMPIHATGLTLNPSEGIVGSEITIPSSCGYGAGSYNIYWGEANILLARGTIDQNCSPIIFIVPEVSRGTYKVTLKVGDNSFDRDFTVIPSISLSDDHGAVGSKLMVTGKGFDSNESDISITYDGDPIETGIEANGEGSWQGTFRVPTSSRGEHIIDAEGVTPATEVDDLIFTVTPKIRISPTSGWVGTIASIVGSGFDSEENDITVTYDGLAVKTGITSDAVGSWQSSFWVPTSAKGSHNVDAYGAVTPETDVNEVTFTVSPGINLELVSGHLGGVIHTGDNLWVSGIGFEANEAGIQVTFDNTPVVSGIVADAKGSWSSQLEVPVSSKGEHIVDASGDTTKASDINDAIVIISPKMEINPVTGAVGDDIIVSGTGFGDNQTITVSYDGDQLATSVVSDASGSFKANFEVPKSKAGDHTITVTDATSSVSSVNFSVESTPPPAPRLISPDAGTRIGFVGKAIITFDWSDVDDPSGISYLLDIGQNPDLSGIVIRKEGLPQSQYILTEDEALSKGDYYWRVKAIDGAENESDWTNVQLLKIGIMEWWQLVLAIIGGIAVIAVIVRIISLSRRGSWK